MRMLFIGGTRFVGRAMAQAAIDAGHQVTVLHRGKTAADELAGAEQLLADRNQDLSVLDGREFDATFDVCAYLPGQVESLHRVLGNRGGHHVYVSTMSVYADTDQSGLDEDAPLVELEDPTVDTVTNETYGGFKVLCERAARSAYAEDQLTIVRPTYVVGPRDYTFRFPWWVRRIAAGGEVLAPGPPASPMQVIDARDQGAWTVKLAEERIPGVFNGIGTALPFGFQDLLDATVEAVGPADTTLTWVNGHWLAEQGVTGQHLPLWSEGEDEWTLAASNTRAVATGLTPRPLTETIADTLTWIRSGAAEPPAGSGLTPDREAKLLSAWRASGIT